MSSLRSVGVFWDIENCCVPKGKSALKIIERIRERFFGDYREAEFICVCDINKESDYTVKDLNDGQINVVHINATAKNAADDKIRQSLRRFSDSHPPGTKVILISSDVNFAADLSDLRHRKKFTVVLIHNSRVSDVLVSCANENYLYEDLIKDLPERPGTKEVKDPLLIITGYSKDGPLDKVRQLLKMISNNCGGKVVSIGPLFAVLKFDTMELLERAKKRMNGEDVYGRKITVHLPEETVFFNTIRKLSVGHMRRQESPSPQRRPQDSNRNRSVTPEKTCGHFGTNGVNLPYSPQSNSYGYQTGNFEGTSHFYPYKEFKTPGGPTSSNPQCKSFAKHNISPNGTYALPNSNSARFYQSSPAINFEGPQPASTDGGGEGSLLPSTVTSCPALDGKNFVIGDLREAAGGSSITVFKPSDNKGLADIPIPSFGFRDLPPPSLPALSTTSTIELDPIKVIENTAREKNIYGVNQHSALANLANDVSQYADTKTCNNQDKNYQSQDTNAGPQSSSYNILSQMSGYQSHQPRSLSVPATQVSASSKEVMSSEDEICMSHGYPPYRSHSQNPHVFKRPPSPKKIKNPNTNNTNLRRISPAMRGNRRNSSSEGEERSQSPSVGSGKMCQSNFKNRPSSVSPTISNQQRISPLPVPNVDRIRVKQYGSNLYRVPTPAEIGDPEMDYTNPDFNAAYDSFVELIVSNLDYNIQPREWRKILYATFQPHVKVLSIQIRVQADNTSLATVRLPTEQDARFAITQFHRRKIGYKRISVQFKSDTSQSPADSLRTDTISLLMEAKDHKMALARLIDLFDRRFHKTVSVSDIYKMRDIIQIQETSGAGRWVKLQPGIRRTPTPTQNSDGEIIEVLDHPVCAMHCEEGTVYYTEALNSCMLPNVVVMRKHFSPQLHSLLLSHNGFLPLMSFPACYAAEFRPLETAREGGIPLEHVISCVPGVEISVSKAGVKVIQFQENREQFYDMMKGNSWQELGKISREVMDLLRQQLTCSMPVSKFIPAYHHYFGRQCRVADHGYTKLQDLFEAIPHAIQVLGTGDRRVITLSPRSQLKRFTTDILKVVKAQPTKQIMLDEFPTAYEKVFGKPLFLPHYGVSFIEDVLSDVPTTTLIVIEEGNHTLLAVPRRDQTPEEVERTKQFAMEVVDLLKHNPQSRMAFNKFIPAYHHHLGRQCRVADYGFNKLTDLFEAVSHVIEIEEEGEERLLHLTAPELRKVLCEQLCTLLRSVGSIPINKLELEYARHFGFGLKLEDFCVDSVRELLLKLKSHVKIETWYGQEVVSLVREVSIPPLGLQVMQLLMDESGGSLPLVELSMRYETLFGYRCDVKQMKEELQDFVQIDETDCESGGIIRLTSHQLLGRNLRILLLHHDRLQMCDLTALYRKQFGVELSPALYGFQTLYQLLHSFPHILQVKGKPTQKYLVLSGMLSTPGVLPPARVDVTSPNIFVGNISSPNPVPEQESESRFKDLEPSSAQRSSDSMSQLLHASQLLDPYLVCEPTTKPLESAVITSSSQIGDQLCQSYFTSVSDESNSGAADNSQQSGSSKTLSPEGIPVSWQIKAGFESNKEVAGGPLLELVSGNLGGMDSSIGIIDKFSKMHLSERLSGISCKKEDSATASEAVEIDLDMLHDQNSKDNSEENLFSSKDLPLDTSSTRSLLNSSSQSSASSPIKRKTRIAAKFNKPL